MTSLLSLLFVGTGCSQLLSDKNPQEACTFVQNKQKQRVSWKSNLPIKFKIHKDVPQAARESLTKAAMEWNLISTQNVIEFLPGDSTKSPSNSYADRTPTIFWLTSWEDSRKSEQARTTVVWSGTTIRDADIRINAEDFEFNFANEDFSPLKVDFISLLVHEMGHALGFAHSDTSKSVMYPRLSKNFDRRDIRHISDLESYACEYGQQIVKPKVLAAAQEGETLSDDELASNEP